MTETIKVGMAQSRVALPPQRLACFGIGSCVCVALYDPKAKVAGLAHAMLPAAPLNAELPESDQPKYADTAVAQLVRSMEIKGAERSRLFARLVGGANMFSFPGKLPEGGGTLGERNLKAARERLRALEISVTAEEGGGGVGRSLEFNPEDGSLLVRTAWADLRWL